MAEPRGGIHHRAERQIWRDTVLHSRSRRLYYRNWTEQAELRLRLSDAHMKLPLMNEPQGPREIASSGGPFARGPPEPNEIGSPPLRPSNRGGTRTPNPPERAGRNRSTPAGRGPAIGG